jgi:hypothetical protein
MHGRGDPLTGDTSLPDGVTPFHVLASVKEITLSQMDHVANFCTPASVQKDEGMCTQLYDGHMLITRHQAHALTQA